MHQSSLYRAPCDDGERLRRIPEDARSKLDGRFALALRGRAALFWREAGALRRPSSAGFGTRGSSTWRREKLEGGGLSS